MRLWSTTEAKFSLKKSLVPSARVIFDVGAKTGEYARRYLRLFLSAQVYSFEPAPDSYKELGILAAGDVRLTSYPVAILDKTGDVDLNIVSRPGACSTLTPSVQWDEVSITTTIKVPATTLDIFCKELSISHIDLLNIDTNGTDLQVLLGAESLLTAGAIDVICAELIFWPYFTDQCKHSEIINLLSGYGMHMIAIFPDYWQGSLRYADAVFIKEQMKGE